MFKLIFTLFMLLSFLVHSDDIDHFEEDAPQELLSTLVVFKTFVSKDLVDGLPMQINYTITNIGDGPATGIQFSDPLSAEHFDLVEGNFTASWPLLESKQSINYHITVIPRISGILTPSPAKIAYFRNPEDTEDEIQYSLSTTEPPVAIVSAFEHDLMTNPRYLEWGVAALVWGASMALPYWVYSYLSNNYPEGMKQIKTE